MRQFVAAKPLELKGIRRRIGERVSETDISPDGLGWLLRMGYLVEEEDGLDPSGGPEDFGVSVLPGDTDVDGFAAKKAKASRSRTKE